MRIRDVRLYGLIVIELVTVVERSFGHVHMKQGICELTRERLSKGWFGIEEGDGKKGGGERRRKGKGWRKDEAKIRKG
jgi:hypothetical protein